MVTLYKWLVSLGHCNNLFNPLPNEENIQEDTLKKYRTQTQRVVSPTQNFSHLEKFRSFIYTKRPYSSSYKAKSKRKPKKESIFLSLCRCFELRHGVGDSACCPAVRNWLLHLLSQTQRGQVSILILLCTHSHRFSKHIPACTLFVCLLVVLFNEISNSDWKIYLLLVCDKEKNPCKTFFKCWQSWIQARISSWVLLLLWRAQRCVQTHVLPISQACTESLGDALSIIVILELGVDHFPKREWEYSWIWNQAPFPPKYWCLDTSRLSGKKYVSPARKSSWWGWRFPLCRLPQSRLALHHGSESVSEAVTHAMPRTLGSAAFCFSP